MLVNIIGIDGCGKSEQINRCVKWISKEYFLPVRVITKYNIDEHPECGFLKFPAVELHNYVCSMKGAARALFFIWAFAVSFSTYNPKKPEVVFTDGYWQKYMVSEKILGIDDEWFRNVCSLFHKPNITLLVDVDPEVILERRKSFKPYECGLDFSCKVSSFLRHQKRMREELLKMAFREGWVIIDGNKDSILVFWDIKEVLEPIIKKLSAEAIYVKLYSKMVHVGSKNVHSVS